MSLHNSKKYGCSCFKNDVIYMHLPFVYKKPISLNLLKIVVLNLIMYIVTVLTCSLKMYVIRQWHFNDY